MAADANLIKGARDAASGASKMAMAGSGELGRVAQSLIGRVDARTADLRKRTEEAKQRDRLKEERFNINQEAALQQAGALGEAEYDFTKRRIEDLQQEYQNCTLGDNACRQKVMMALSKESQGLTSMKDTRALNAKALLNLRGDVSAEQQEVMGIYANSQSGKYDIVEGKDGEIRYTFDLGEGKEASYTKNELDKMFEAQKDNVGSEATKKRSLANIEKGKAGEVYNEEQEGAAFDNLTKTDNSLRSYLNDEWLGGENFSGSMDSKIKSDIEVLKSNPNIQNLDIPIGDGETNWYDNITEEDAALIKQKLMNPQTEEEIKSARLVARQHYIDTQKQQHEKGKKQAKAAADKETSDRNFKLYQETHKNNLRMALENVKDENEIDQILLKFRNDMKKKAQDHYNSVNEDIDKLKVVQANARSQWDDITFDKGVKPVSKAQTYMDNFRNILGDDVTDIRYGTDFVDEQGNTQAKGYYAVINVADDKGGTKEVNQLISIGDDLSYDDVNRYLDPKKMLIKQPPAEKLPTAEEISTWLKNNPSHPDFDKVKEKYEKDYGKSS